MKKLPVRTIIDRKTGEVKEEYREVTDEEYDRYTRPLLRELAEHYAETGKMLLVV